MLRTNLRIPISQLSNRAVYGTCYRFSQNVQGTLIYKSSYSTENGNISPMETHIKGERQNLESELTNHVPWYLKLGEKQRHDLLSQMSLKDNTSNAIEYPEGLEISTNLKTISEYLVGNLGLSNIVVFDMTRNKHDEDQFDDFSGREKIGDKIILSTALSLKHCHNSYLELNQYLKQQYNILPSCEGKLNGQELRRIQKRLKRKNLKKIYQESIYNGKNSQLNDAWYMIDCKVDGIIVNILTKQKREDLNLEELYSPIGSKYRSHNIKEFEDDIQELSKDTPPFNDTINHEPSILAGLKRLSNQRRHYSTTSLDAAALRRSLQDETFPNSTFKIIETLQFDNYSHNLLTILCIITNELGNRLYDPTATIKIKDWKIILEKIWPLVLPDDEIESFWTKRFEYLSLLNTIDPSQYHLSNFLNDYFIYKKTSGYSLNRQELVDFLKLAIINLEENNGSGILPNNALIAQILSLYNGDSSDIGLIVKDSELINLLFQTLTTKTGKQLPSLTSLIDYILKETKNRPEPAIIVSILRGLAKAQKWDIYFDFWVNKLEQDDIGVGQDYRPWHQFIQYIVESDDQHILYRLIQEGHLLWLKRFRVNITPEIELQIISLFDKLDPGRQTFGRFETDLLNNE